MQSPSTSAFVLGAPASTFSLSLSSLDRKSMWALVLGAPDSSDTAIGCHDEDWRLCVWEREGETRKAGGGRDKKGGRRREKEREVRERERRRRRKEERTREKEKGERRRDSRREGKRKRKDEARREKDMG